jgi:exodeoxyribonuclease VII large subunit
MDAWITEPSSGGLPRYSVAELNNAIGSLLERGFSPRFLLEATVSRPQLKKGHLWMTLVDEAASIGAVVWASQLARLSFRPEDGDGVTVVGKLNFWVARAALSVQILDVRPSLSSVLRRFERVRETLQGTGLFAASRKRPLPAIPEVIALLTSVPSSALADMLRTASERWPLTKILVVPIPVQGQVEAEICRTVRGLSRRAASLGLDALVLARGGGSREDLSVFDGEELARTLAEFPVPVVTGLGHEDDTTIADLVADFRAATPTAAVVALLPDRLGALQELISIRAQLERQIRWKLMIERQRQEAILRHLSQVHPRRLLERHRFRLDHLRELLEVLSPRQQLRRGFCLVRRSTGELIRSVNEVAVDQAIQIQWSDGKAAGLVTATSLDGTGIE